MAFSWRDCREPRKPTVRIAFVPVKVHTAADCFLCAMRSWRRKASDVLVGLLRGNTVVSQTVKNTVTSAVKQPDVKMRILRGADVARLC